MTPADVTTAQIAGALAVFAAGGVFGALAMWIALWDRPPASAPGRPTGPATGRRGRPLERDAAPVEHGPFEDPDPFDWDRPRRPPGTRPDIAGYRLRRGGDAA